MRPFQRWPVLIAATVAEVCRRESGRTMGTNNNAIIIRSMCWGRNVHVFAAGCAHMPDWICAIVFAPDCGHTNARAQTRKSRLRLPHDASLRAGYRTQNAHRETDNTRWLDVVGCVGRRGRLTSFVGCQTSPSRVSLGQSSRRTTVEGLFVESKSNT